MGATRSAGFRGGLLQAGDGAGGAGDGDWYAQAIVLPFALQRLVVVNARMGKFAEAERWWVELQHLATKPDDEFRPLMTEARDELASARAREGPAGH